MLQKLTTKERIFRKSINLFSEHGYESVSMKNIAAACGIQSASIYNHFESKEEILKNIYHFFIENKNICRPKKQDYTPILKTGTAVDILMIFIYPVHSDPEIDALMIDIIQIICSRLYMDQDAKNIYREYIVEDAYRYIHETLSEGIALGRIIIASDKLDALVNLLLSARTFVANTLPLYNESNSFRKNGPAMIEMLAGTLVLTPPLE